VCKEKKLMNMKVIASLIAVVVSVAPSVYGQAQQKDQPKPSQEQQADRPGEASMTGCLTEQQGSWTLATTAGEQISVSGSNLNTHKDHTVKLTGTTGAEGGKKTLAVTKIELVSTSCAK
jgi:hypothetical protein